VQAFAAGMLSILGHSPTFAVRDFKGEARFEDGRIETFALELTIRAGSLELLDKVARKDREEIETRMDRDVLATSAYPEIEYTAQEVAATPSGRGQFHVRMDGRLSLYGQSHPHAVDADLKIFGNGIQLVGDSLLRMSEYGIPRVTALAGAIKLKDEVKVTFDLFGQPENP
jgi:polyisoprenoid-binding protein YceI